MGVVGLLTQLVRSTSPAKTVYQNGQSRNILLVDASCVEYEICTQTGADFNTPGVEQTVYDATRTFYDELFKACPGIRIVGIVDSAPGPGHESTYLRRRKERFAEGFALGPVVAAAHLAAASDAGVELIRSVESADPLLLAYYVQHEPRIFGLLTVDSDFFVYGTERIILLNWSKGWGDEQTRRDGIVFDALGRAEFNIWSCSDAWRKLRATAWVDARKMKSIVTWPLAEHPPVAGISHLRRAEIAALMGNDVSKAIRGRLEALAEKASAAGTRVLSTAKAAKLALTYPGGTGADGVIAAAAVASSSSLSGNFFAACGLRSFSPADMRNFALVANEYIEHRRLAENGSWKSLTLKPDNLPWLRPEIATWLGTSPVAMRDLVAWGCRGISARTGREGGRAADEPRAAAAAALFAPGARRNVYDYDPSTNEFIQLVAADPPAPPQLLRNSPAAPASFLALPFGRRVASSTSPSSASPAGGAGGGSGASRLQLEAQLWFDPAAIPELSLVDGFGIVLPGSSGAAPLVTFSTTGKDLRATCGALDALLGEPSCPRPLVMYSALMLHATGACGAAPILETTDIAKHLGVARAVAVVVPPLSPLVSDSAELDSWEDISA